MNHKIPYQNTKHFSKLVLDYLNQDKKLTSFVNHFPTLDNFEKQIKEKSTHEINRETLVSVLEKQNAIISLSDISKSNIQLLKDNHTFTITTGHQLCLFTGPLYFLYKIISTINLSEKLKEKYPNNNFIPIFWMATEDHDFQEINHINLYGKKVLEWEQIRYRITHSQHNRGAMGRMSLNGIERVINVVARSILGESDHGQRLLNLFEKAYLKNQNLADATRYLVNELFGKYGLVIIDGDNKQLKKQFIPYIKKDVLEQGFVKTIQESSKKLASSYSAQAFVRDVNFFKLSEEKRELIKGDITEREIEENSERFSPNVLLRPLYQECVLPNIATIGGGAEIAYWMQLKSAFQQEKMPFPLLVLRNSVMLISDKQMQIIRAFNFELFDIFKDEHALQKQYIIGRKLSEIDLTNEKEDIKRIYSMISNKISDSGLRDNIKAQLKKQLNALDTLELKLIRLEKQKDKYAVNQISRLKKQLFPDNSLQERYENFIQFYLKDGNNFIERLKQNLNPLDPNFVILSD
ncbi:MAG: bacillithiol biosynthesis cysteine-adding enzyme BshC [Bacteroidota bacterium]|nr:bacillithiol biosynthesis cysteine-adding enzyme BshC [Bacteroidota bacterium]